MSGWKRNGARNSDQHIVDRLDDAWPLPWKQMFDEPFAEQAVNRKTSQHTSAAEPGFAWEEQYHAEHNPKPSLVCEVRNPRKNHIEKCAA
ncbi:MAG: hypothetical protein Q4D42_10785 [Eubacteriales bacterium]|nr:hypothetical protein [Eubacteriales bacterium]